MWDSIVYTKTVNTFLIYLDDAAVYQNGNQFSYDIGIGYNEETPKRVFISFIIEEKENL
jgi:hypothetical protein